MENKIIYVPYVISCIIDSILQILIYLVFYEIEGSLGLTYVFLAKYTLSNLMYPIHLKFMSKKSLSFIAVLLIFCFLFLLIFMNYISMVVIAFALISLLNSFFMVKFNSNIHEKYDDKARFFSTLRYISSICYTLGSLLVFVLNSNTFIIIIVLLVLSIINYLILLSRNTWLISSDVVNTETEKQNNNSEFTKLPKFVYLIIFVYVLSLLIDNFEYAFIIENIGIPNNYYSMIIFISGIAFIVFSKVMTKLNHHEKNYYSNMMLSLILFMFGYYLFIISNSFLMLIISFSVIALGNTMYEMYFSSYIVTRFKKHSEDIFVKFRNLLNIFITIVFLLSNIYLRKGSITTLYTAMTFLIFLICSSLLLYYIFLKYKQKLDVNS